jgi:Cu(I)/Ag(I) efflux system membrane protein CusA/SilA
MTPPGPLERLLRFCIGRKLVVFLITGLALFAGVLSAPFDRDLGGLPRDPVPVDAIPDIGENQQIVFTEWMGRSPQDVEDQVTYPLTVSLLGVPGVRTVRSFSMFGFSSIYVIFEEDVEFYWSRSRILEKLASLPDGTLPEGVKPALGPDATALGQVYWYTLEGRDPHGNVTGGWDLHELRSIQDWTVRFGLASAAGVAEVASVGGHVREYQVDVDPDALRAYGVTLEEVLASVRMSNLDVSARTVEVNQVEYVIRGVGLVKGVDDLRRSVIAAPNGTPVRVEQVAEVATGPALRRGLLDKGGTEAVGGVVVVRHGANPLRAIESVKARIAEISPGLPKKVLPDGTVSQVTIVPFYDRTDLIHETLETLDAALTEEILVTLIVVLVMVVNLRSSLLVATILPFSVLLTFLAMRRFGVDANIVALSGIAIAIGTMVDMGIVIVENILRHLREAAPEEDTADVIARAGGEVGGAVITAVATTIVSFLPVFVMTGAEGKLFKPLAFTKTYALLAAVLVAVLVLPPLAHLLFRRRRGRGGPTGPRSAGPATDAPLATQTTRSRRMVWLGRGFNVVAVGSLLILLADHWRPLGLDRAFATNLVFVGLLLGGLLTGVLLFVRAYPRMLRWCLDHKAAYLLVPATVMLLGGFAWLGFDAFFGWLPRAVRNLPPVAAMSETFPGMGREFMPPLDEGSFLFMPTTMPHASIGEAAEILATEDMAILAVPEVASAVGKIGRVSSALDPAPISMVETVIAYHPEFRTDPRGHPERFVYDPDSVDVARAFDGTPLLAPDGEPYRVRGVYRRSPASVPRNGVAEGNGVPDLGEPIPDEGGHPFRTWRRPLDPEINPGRTAWPGVTSPDDIWTAIADAAAIPGVTGAPKLQPIAARLVMLQSGMRAPLGVKVQGPDLATIEAFGLELERLLSEVPAVAPGTVIADRIVGKPYLEIRIDRDAIARHGIHLAGVQGVIQAAVGGMAVTHTVEGRERYSVRVRYARERRDHPEAIGRVLVAAPGGAQVPLGELAEIRYVRGPQVIKSEDTRLTGYVLFDRVPGVAEVDVVEAARAHLDAKVASGELDIPAGVSYAFAGSYENQIRAQKTLSVVLPSALLVIVVILYLQFGSMAITTLVFSGIGVAWAGGFILLWAYGQPWFLDVSVFGGSLRELFGMGPTNLSVAVWVGFLALFGIATDDGVLIATYLNQSFRERRPGTVAEIRAATLEAGTRRIRPCMMTTATTVLALVPVLTSTGRGSDLMVPMAIPSFGGMTLVVLTTFMVPVLYAWREERRVAT